MYKSIVLLFLFGLTIPLLAADIRTTANGKPVVLHDNGTWNYVSSGDPKVCKAYANHAHCISNALNSQARCNFSGPRWHTNYNKHYNACMGSKFHRRAGDRPKFAVTHLFAVMVRVARQDSVLQKLRESCCCTAA